MRFREVKEGQFFVIVNGNRIQPLLRMGSDGQVLEVRFRSPGTMEARITKVSLLTPITEVQIIDVPGTKA